MIDYKDIVQCITITFLSIPLFKKAHIYSRKRLHYSDGRTIVKLYLLDDRPLTLVHVFSIPILLLFIYVEVYVHIHIYMHMYFL